MITSLSKGFWLPIYKPQNISSAKCLYPIKSLVKRSLTSQYASNTESQKKLPKIGHSGTLDPFAEGVLLTGIGKTTRLMQYSLLESKSYSFTVKWGSATDTYDNTGKIVATTSKIPREKDILLCLKRFTGTIQQVPPIYSAIKINGEKAYALARKGQDFSIPARNVTVYAITMTDHDEISTSFTVDCASGLYVRSLAVDIAKSLESLCYVTSLIRTRIGNISLDQCNSVSCIDNADTLSSQEIITFAPEHMLPSNIEKIEVDATSASSLSSGSRITIPETTKFHSPHTEKCAIMHNNQLICIAKIDNFCISPITVLAS